MTLVEQATELAATLRELAETPEVLQPGARARAGDLVREIDGLIGDLYRARGELASAVRVYDTARGRWLDERLEARRRGGGR